jgi:hypothetical protein
MKKAIWILWPSFIVGGIAETIFFTFFDPMEMQFFGEIGVSRVAVYSIGFLLFWAFAAASSAFTCFLQRSAEEINRCPLPPAGRPEGSPKEETSNAAR